MLVYLHIRGNIHSGSTDAAVYLPLTRTFYTCASASASSGLWWSLGPTISASASASAPSTKTSIAMGVLWPPQYRGNATALSGGTAAAAQEQIVCRGMILVGVQGMRFTLSSRPTQVPTPYIHKTT
jgi:hypothetical protein